MKSGIFNLGTGRAQSFNDVGTSVINLVLKTKKTTEELYNDGLIEYIPFPEGLNDKYQAYTQADISFLKESGYNELFTSVENGVIKHVAFQEKKFCRIYSK